MCNTRGALSYSVLLRLLPAPPEDMNLEGAPLNFCCRRTSRKKPAAKGGVLMVFGFSGQGLEAVDKMVSCDNLSMPHNVSRYSEVINASLLIFLTLASTFANGTTGEKEHQDTFVDMEREEAERRTASINKEIEERQKEIEERQKEIEKGLEEARNRHTLNFGDVHEKIEEGRKKIEEDRKKMEKELEKAKNRPVFINPYTGELHMSQDESSSTTPRILVSRSPRHSWPGERNEKAPHQIGFSDQISIPYCAIVQ